MNYEIIGETVKSAFSKKIGQIFGNDTIRYKETIANPIYPHFSISQLRISVTNLGRNRFELLYTINVTYRVAQDLGTVNNLEQKLDEVGYMLCTHLTEIDLGTPVKTLYKRYEKVDGNVQFMCDIRVRVKFAEEELEKMKQYSLNEEVIL